MKPNWNDAPEWANWLAQNADGTWFWFEVKPFPWDTPNGHYWKPHHREYKLADIGSLNHAGWRDTLEHRPPPDPERWYLISEKDAMHIRVALQDAMGGIAVADFYHSTLHRLDSGLHTTNCVPADFAEDEDEVDTSVGCVTDSNRSEDKVNKRYWYMVYIYTANGAAKATPISSVISRHPLIWRKELQIEWAEDPERRIAPPTILFWDEVDEDVAEEYLGLK